MQWNEDFDCWKILITIKFIILSVQWTENKNKLDSQLHSLDHKKAIANSDEYRVVLFSNEATIYFHVYIYILNIIFSAPS